MSNTLEPKSPNNTATDEDWAVISSCSEIEEECASPANETNTLDDSVATQLQMSEDKLGESSVAYSILKLPEIKTDGSYLHNSDENCEPPMSPPKEDISNKKEPFPGSPVTPSSPISANPSDIKSISSINSVAPEIGEKISFFENLSRFNPLISQKSDDFNANYAEEKMERIKTYISDQHEQLKETPTDENATSSANETPSEHYVYAISDDSKTTPSVTPISSRPQKVMKRKKVLIECLEQLELFLERNSDFLYYYLFGFVVSIIALGYGLNYYLYTKAEQAPTTSLDLLSQFWDNMLYEKQASNRGLFSFAKAETKVSRLNKLSHMFEQRVEIYGASFANKAPVLQRFVTKKFLDFKDLGQIGISRLDAMGKQALKAYSRIENINIGKFSKVGYTAIGSYFATGWDKLDKYSRLGLNSSDKYSRLGWNNMSKYCTIGWNNLNIYGIKGLNNLEKYGKNSWGNVDRYAKLGWENVDRYGKLGWHSLNKYGKHGVSDLDKYSRMGLKGLGSFGQASMSTVEEVTSSGMKAAKKYGYLGLAYATIGAERILDSSRQHLFSRIFGNS
ncbi:uncharacterized protein J8A68_003691 [[Candida] subhashii]|uniref:Uncharacterized protein n=1 Tax=[Candida] subhashii TaxID=561895 RepID=A0A8J5QLQ1_9ASCO|nr:uncharacterized protein J8A68_003691 [[Candida] subhashii]KAG7662768.1 hypothetical protein J8A68_003691 [[Candida] subhashii]